MLGALLTLLLIAAPAGHVRRDSPALDALIALDAKIEVIAEGIRWSEGPVWISDGGYLLFSDVPGNRMHRWSERDGLSVFLEPSGHPGPDTSAFREPGSNGLIRGSEGAILMADHGNRGIARLDLATKTKTLLATQYQGKAFNSPNDLVLAASGSIYFTDPPYGLEGIDASPLKAQPRNGVYRLDPDGSVTLIDGRLSKPNGIGLSPDGRTLYVSNSDPASPFWYAYALDRSGDALSRRTFADASAEIAKGEAGLPDGFCLDDAGNLFASGPGGLFVFTPAGDRLGRIETGDLVSNCTFGGPDGRTLFITSNHRVVRVPTRTKGSRSN